MDLPVITTRPANPHFVRLGGADAVVRLAAAFYRRMDTLPEARAIRAMHAADLAPMQAVLIRYLSEWLGGPRLYSPVHGAPRLGRVHAPFAIGPAERDAWLHCMALAMDDIGTAPALHRELMAAFAKVADHLTRHHPHGAPNP